MSGSKANKSRTFNILNRALVRVALAGDGRWEIHQAHKPYTFQPLAALSHVVHDDGTRIFNLILGPIAVDIGIL